MNDDKNEGKKQDEKIDEQHESINNNDVVSKKESKNKQKIYLDIDKSKIIANVITGSLITIISGIVLISMIVIVRPFDGIATSSKDKNFNAQVKRISDALESVSSTYIDSTDLEKLANGAIEGITNTTGDPYTRYISQDEYTDMLKEGTDTYGGIGVHVTYDETSNGIIVLGLVPDSPASQNDIQPGDIITKVGSDIVTKDNYQKCVDDMKGDENTQVTISIKRGDQTFDKTLTRKKLVASNVESKVLENNIGYIRILAFENNIADQFKEQYDKLRAQNISGLILDLRDNPGGLVDQTVDIANMLLPKGEIVKLVDKAGQVKMYNSDGKNEINIPLVVLVNSRSASASEILSSAIKDTKKGVLVGTKTYGKGIVQTVQSLDGDGALAVTTAKYYTLSGIEIQKNGIEPNYTVELPDDVKNNLYVTSDKDTQLKKAIEIVKAGGK